MDEKSVSHRKGCLLGILAVLGEEEGFEPILGLAVDKDVVQRRYMDDLERCIKLGATDRDIEIRKIAKRAWLIYRREFSERIQRQVRSATTVFTVLMHLGYSFAAPLTPITRKYLELPPPGQAMPAFASTSTAGTAVEKPISRPILRQVSRPVAPPRAPSPVKPSASSRPASRAADLGKSTSSLTSLMSKHNEQTSSTASQSHVPMKSGSRPPSRQALPSHAPPIQLLRRSVSASGAFPFQQNAPHKSNPASAVFQPVDPPAQGEDLANSVPRPVPAPSTGLLPSAANGARIWAAAAANLAREDDTHGQQTSTTAPAAQNRPPSREAPFRPFASGPRRFLSHQRLPSANASAEAAAPVQHHRGPQRAPLPVRQEDEHHCRPSHGPEAEEVVPQKRPASAMSSSSVPNVVWAPRREVTPLLTASHVLESQPAEAASETIGNVEPAQALPTTTISHAARSPEQHSSDRPTAIIDQAHEMLPIASLSTSCPPSASVFAPQPPLPVVDLTALAAQLPNSAVQKSGRQAFRPARPNISNQQPLSQLRRVPSTLSVKQAAQPTRSISASSVPLTSKSTVSLKDALAVGRAQASSSAVVKPKSATAAAMGPPPAKKQALSSSTSSANGTSQSYLSKSTSSATSTSKRAVEAKALPNTAQARPLAFKSTSAAPSSAAQHAPRARPQGSIFSRLAAPTASSAARARAVSGSSSTSSRAPASTKAAKETFKRPGVPASKFGEGPALKKSVSSNVPTGARADELPGIARAALQPSTEAGPTFSKVDLASHIASPAEEASLLEKCALAPQTDKHDTIFMSATQTALPDTPEPEAQLPEGLKSSFDSAQSVEAGGADDDLVIDSAAGEAKAEESSAWSATAITTSDASSEDAARTQEQVLVRPTDLNSESEFACGTEETSDSTLLHTALIPQMQASAISQPHSSSQGVQTAFDSLDSLLAATIDNLSLASDQPCIPQQLVPVQESMALRSHTPDYEPADLALIATARKDEGPMPLVDPSSSILFSSTKASGIDGLLDEDEPSQFAGDETVIEHSSTASSLALVAQADALAQAVPIAGELDSALRAEAVENAAVERLALSQETTKEDEEEDDIALLISRELSDDSLEELASRFETSRLFPTMRTDDADAGDWDDEEIENTPVRPRLLTRSIGTGSEAGSSESDDEDATERLTMTAGKASSRNINILAGLSKTPMPVKGQTSVLDERDILRTM